MIILIIIGLATKNSFLILSQVISLAIPDLLWTFDFFYTFFTGHNLLGIAGYFIKEDILGRILSLQHLYVAPLSIVALFILGVKKDYRILLLSFGEVILIFLLTLIFVPASSGVNCIHVNCTIISLNFLPFPLVWFIFEFGFITLSYFIVTSLPFVKKKLRIRPKTIRGERRS